MSSKESLLQKEFDSLGVYLSGHPLDGVLKMSDCKTLADCECLKGMATVVIQVLKVIKKKTKYGKPMASIDIQDKTKTAKLFIWSEIYETIMPMFKTNAILKIAVKPNHYKGFENTGLNLVCVNAEEI